MAQLLSRTGKGQKKKKYFLAEMPQRFATLRRERMGRRKQHKKSEPRQEGDTENVNKNGSHRLTRGGPTHTCVFFGSVKRKWAVLRNLTAGVVAGRPRAVCDMTTRLWGIEDLGSPPRQAVQKREDRALSLPFGVA